MNIFKKFGYMFMAGVAVATAASCSDPDAEITSVEYARYFTPTDVTMKIVDQTSIEVEFTSISKAESYEIEFYQGETISGSAVKTVTMDGVGTKKNTIVVDGFLGKTTYIAQVRAAGSKPSNWGVSDKFVTTKEEQILLESKPGDITETSIKVRWIAGTEVTKLTIGVVDGDGQNEITLSAAEKENGVVTIDGLTAGTEYNVAIYNGDMQRGKKVYGTSGVAPKPIVIEGVFIDYQAAEAPTEGITLEGTTVMSNQKIHEDAEAVPGMQLKNGYSSDGAPTGNDIKLTVEGGFKVGDKITIAGFFNNSDESKKSAADIFVIGADNTCRVLFTTKPFINGKKPGDPVAESFVLTEDAEVLYVGRNGNTGTNICLLQVERGAEAGGGDNGGGEVTPPAADDPFMAQGTLLTFDEKKDTYSVDGLVLKITDEDGKTSVDDNTAFFGASPAAVAKFTKRLKTGGKSSSKNNMTLTVPAAGKIYICVRTGSNSATDRNVIVSKGETELANKILLESEALADQTIEGEANPQKLYAPVVVDVEAGDYSITYPTNGINFYGIKFIAK